MRSLLVNGESNFQTQFEVEKIHQTLRRAQITIDDKQQSPPAEHLLGTYESNK